MVCAARTGSTLSGYRGRRHCSRVLEGECAAVVPASSTAKCALAKLVFANVGVGWWAKKHQHARHLHSVEHRPQAAHSCRSSGPCSNKAAENHCVPTKHEGDRGQSSTPSKEECSWIHSTAIVDRWPQRQPQHRDRSATCSSSATAALSMPAHKLAPVWPSTLV